MKVIPITVSAGVTGFSSPAQNYEKPRLSLDQLLIRDENCTYFCRVNGDSMAGESVIHNDILVVDRSLDIKQFSPVVCNFNGEMLFKRIDLKHRKLLSSSELYPAIDISAEDTLTIEGVVIAVVRDMKG
ncbi:LexA family protein [Vibrio casei]|uniref:LexA family protein n=1 Tax=Vibrio casei TaxID=673372 RepID=UPI000B5C9F44|nr:S24 family peptidase [Vibrio casei]